MSKITIIGHKNPDTDSIISALAAQEYFAQALGKEAQAFRTGQLNNETKFILETLGVEVPALFSAEVDPASVALVDHNEAAQLAPGLDFAKVDFIFDHHKLAIVTEKPIFARLEPLGSTSSLIAKMFFEKGVAPTQNTAQLLLAGILSDTLNFTSPTTTPEDTQLAAKLNVIAELDVASFAGEMFKAKSSLEGISTLDITTLDYKEFEMGTSKVGVGTWETTDPESVNAKKTEIFELLAQRKAAEKLDYLFFMVVDILKGNCQLYVISEAESLLAEKVFGVKSESGVAFLPGVVSRKKQIVQPLTEQLNK